MDIKEGHPGGVFHWFFDTDQGTDSRVNLLVMLYGSRPDLRKLVEECLMRQEEFNDATGPEILFLFFDPNTKVEDLCKDGGTLRRHLTQEEPKRFLFAGYGEAYAVPSGMIEIGRERFRSELPDSYYFSNIDAEAARAHSRAIPFFQQAFDLRPMQSGLIFAHRTLREIIVYDFGGDTMLTPKSLLEVFSAMRPIARHSRGESDLDAVDALITGKIEHSKMKAGATKAWNTISKLAKLSGVT